MDAAVNGRRKFQGKAYFFDGDVHNRLLRVEDVLRFRTPAEVSRDGAEAGKNLDVDMAYTYGAGTVNLTQYFLTLHPDHGGAVTGPRYRAAMLMHETGHWVGLADHAYEHESAYDTLPIDKAVENTSSFVFFAQHLESLRDTRHDPDPETR